MLDMQQQINFLQLLEQNKNNIINNTQYNENVDTVDNDVAYNTALIASAANILNLQIADVNSMLVQLQFTSNAGDMLDILHTANINSLIADVQNTYS